MLSSANFIFFCRPGEYYRNTREINSLECDICYWIIFAALDLYVQQPKWTQRRRKKVELLRTYLENTEYTFPFFVFPSSCKTSSHTRGSKSFHHCCTSCYPPYIRRPCYLANELLFLHVRDELRRSEKSLRPYRSLLDLQASLGGIVVFVTIFCRCWNFYMSTECCGRNGRCW